jgi:hypothetical protein
MMFSVVFLALSATAAPLQCVFQPTECATECNYQAGQACKITFATSKRCGEAKCASVVNPANCPVPKLKCKAGSAVKKTDLGLFKCPEFTCAPLRRDPCGRPAGCAFIKCDKDSQCEVYDDPFTCYVGKCERICPTFQPNPAFCKAPLQYMALVERQGECPRPVCVPATKA